MHQSYRTKLYVTSESLG